VLRVELAIVREHADTVPGPGDALIIVDVQADFLPGGALPVPGGDQVIPLLNRYIAHFGAAGRPVFATRDWHPADHVSFTSQGGNWPPHCVAHSPGAAFAQGLLLPPDTRIVSKARDRAEEAYSAFQGTDLASQLREAGITRVFVGGLATDYCVLETVLGALQAGFQVVLLEDAIRAVNLRPEDGSQAMQIMGQRGAVPVTLEALADA